MTSRLFLVIALVIISLISASKCVYLSPKAGYLYASQYPYGFPSKFLTVTKPDTETKECSNAIATKTIEISKPTVEIDAIKTDLTDKFPTVSDNIKNDIRQYFKNKLEVEELSGVEKPIVTQAALVEPVGIELKPGIAIQSDKITVPDVNVNLNRFTSKKKLKTFKSSFNKKLTRVNIKQKKANVSLKLKSAPKLEAIKCNMPKLKNRFSTNINKIHYKYNVNTNVKKGFTKLKTKRSNVNLAIKRKYIGLRTSPKTQIYLNNVKTKLPEVKCKTTLKLKELQLKASKINLKKAAPVVVSGELLRRRISRPKVTVGAYNFKNVKTNFNRYRVKRKSITVPETCKLNIKNRKLLNKRLSSLRYKRGSLKQTVRGKKINLKGVSLTTNKDINLGDYIKENIAANKSGYLKLLGKECGCGKLVTYKGPKLHKCKKTTPKLYRSEVVKYETYTPVL